MGKEWTNAELDALIREYIRTCPTSENLVDYVCPMPTTQLSEVVKDRIKWHLKMCQCCAADAARLIESGKEPLVCPLTDEEISKCMEESLRKIREMLKSRGQDSI